MISVLDDQNLLDEALAGIIVKAAEAALNAQDRGGDACVAVMGDEEIRQLNKEYRDIDSPTDVLSFSNSEGGALVLGEPDEFLGDIAISVPAALRQAGEIGHGIEREIAFLTVHGMLHLLGYDHIGQSDEAAMLESQRRIMESLGAFK